MQLEPLACMKITRERERIGEDAATAESETVKHNSHRENGHSRLYTIRKRPSDGRRHTTHVNALESGK